MDVISYALSKKYTDEKDLEQKVKISKVEKEINDFRNTFNQMNINQEATQKASGYGIISLPKNAANGQISGVEVKGNTIVNYYNNDKAYLFSGEKLDTGFKLVRSDNDRFVYNSIQNLKQGTYTLICDVTDNTTTYNTSMQILYEDGSIVYPKILNAGYIGSLKVVLEFIQNVQEIRFFIQSAEEYGITYTLENIMLLEGDWTDKEINYFKGTKSTISAMRLKSESADKTQKSLMYLPNVGELRSLPNGTKDEIRPSQNGYECVKRIGNEKSTTHITTISYTNNKHWILSNTSFLTATGETLVIPASSKISVNNGQYQLVTTGHDDITNRGKIYLNTDGKLRYVTDVAVTDISSIFPLELTYQLAEPIITPIQVSGNLITYPSGTIYIEPVVADAGIYTSNGITILHQELPIDYIEKISKIDFETGLETELDTSQAIISEDGTYFIHPELVEGDIVFFEYYYPSDMTTQGETEVEYYDSRYVIQDSVTGKFYKWTIAVADGVPSIQLQEV